MSGADQGKVIVCRAAVAWAPKQPLFFEIVEVAPPKANEVRVKIVSTAVCHTDHTLGAHNHLEGNFPVILGHEGAGIVESVGKNVTKFKPGDHVIPLFLSQCYDCAFCKHPETNLCGKIMATQEKGLMPDGTTRFTCKGQPIFHFMGCSTFSEYTVVPDISLCKINEKAPLNKVCLLGCGVATGYGAAINNAKVKPGSVCGVWGLGTVGLAAAMGCRKAGAAKVYGIDLNPSKFELARKFGCTDFVNPKDYEGKNMKDVLVKLTNGGFDHTIECIGNIHTMRLALESTHAGWGRSVIIGASSPELEISTKPLRLLEGRTWTGTIFGGWKSVDSVPKLVEEYMRGELQLDDFITHTMKLDKINEAFDLLLSGKSLRTVLEL